MKRITALAFSIIIIFSLLLPMAISVSALTKDQIPYDLTENPRSLGIDGYNNWYMYHYTMVQSHNGKNILRHKEYYGSSSQPFILNVRTQINMGIVQIPSIYNQAYNIVEYFTDLNGNLLSGGDNAPFDKDNRVGLYTSTLTNTGDGNGLTATNNFRIIKFVWGGQVTATLDGQGDPDQIIPAPPYKENWTYTIKGIREYPADGERLIITPYDVKNTQMLSGKTMTGLSEKYSNGFFSVNKAYDLIGPPYINDHAYKVDGNMRIDFGAEVTTMQKNEILDGLELKYQYFDSSKNEWSDELPKLFNLYNPYFVDSENHPGYKAFGIYVFDYQVGTKVKLNFYLDDELLRSDEWIIAQMEGVIDSNNDGYDDRTQPTDENGNIIDDGTGVKLDDYIKDYTIGNNSGLASITPETFSNFVNGIKDFFTNLWGILPAEINVLIITGITIMISVAVLKAVL